MRTCDIGLVRKEITEFFNSKENFAVLDSRGQLTLRQFSSQGNELMADVINIYKKQLLVLADLALVQMERKKKRSLWEIIKSKK